MVFFPFHSLLLTLFFFHLFSMNVSLIWFALVLHRNCQINLLDSISVVDIVWWDFNLIGVSFLCQYISCLYLLSWDSLDWVILCDEICHFMPSLVYILAYLSGFSAFSHTDKLRTLSWLPRSSLLSRLSWSLETVSTQERWQEAIIYIDLHMPLSFGLSTICRELDRLNFTTSFFSLLS